MALIRLQEFASTSAVEDAMNTLLREELQRQTPYLQAVIISGGRTPLPVYQAIAEAPFPVAASAWLAFSDDRHVPVSSPDSNFGHALPMIRALRLPEDRVLCVHPELPLEAAADRYDRDLRAFLEAGGRFSVAILGLGPDGHTCSLFSADDLDRGGGDRLAISVRRTPGPDRVSVTPALLEKADRIIFLVAGAEKWEVTKRLIADPDSVVAGRAVANCRDVSLWRA